jgi:hypothetical protein
MYWMSESNSGGGRYRAVIMLTCLLVPGVSAAAEPQPKATTSAGKFYVVQADGKSEPQDPVRSGFAVSPDKRLSGPGEPRGKSSAPPRVSAEASGRVSGPVTIRISGAGESSEPRDDLAEFRCEQLGFYYTQDGRCVAPAGARRLTPRPRTATPPASRARR